MLAKGAKILVVDDRSILRRITRDFLLQMGYSNVEVASDGVEALAKLRSASYDFLIVDWNMPKMTGIELVREIRSDEKLKDIPVLIVMTEMRMDNIREAMRVGVNHYLIKPFRADELMGKMEKIFKDE